MFLVKPPTRIHTQETVYKYDRVPNHFLSDQRLHQIRSIDEQAVNFASTSKRIACLTHRKRKKNRENTILAKIKNRVPYYHFLQGEPAVTIWQASPLLTVRKVPTDGNLIRALISSNFHFPHHFQPSHKRNWIFYFS